MTVPGMAAHAGWVAVETVVRAALLHRFVTGMAAYAALEPAMPGPVPGASCCWQVVTVDGMSWAHRLCREGFDGTGPCPHLHHLHEVLLACPAL